MPNLSGSWRARLPSKTTHRRLDKSNGIIEVVQALSLAYYFCDSGGCIGRYAGGLWRGHDHDRCYQRRHGAHDHNRCTSNGRPGRDPI